MSSFINLQFESEQCTRHAVWCKKSVSPKKHHTGFCLIMARVAYFGKKDTWRMNWIKCRWTMNITYICNITQHIPSGNQTWLAGKFTPLSSMISPTRNQQNIWHFPASQASHIWWHNGQNHWEHQWCLYSLHPQSGCRRVMHQLEMLSDFDGWHRHEGLSMVFRLSSHLAKRVYTWDK